MSTTSFELVDLPIEFKEINPSDFDSNYYNVSDKQIIAVDGKGYISSKIEEIVRDNYDEKNTVIINAGVGQGKSYAVLSMIKNYLKFEEYIVILAVPYKSLIKQYVNELIKIEVKKENIFNFLSFEEGKNEYSNTNAYPQNNLNSWGYIDVDEVINKDKLHEKVHVMTINALLGNSGEDSLFQSHIKTQYFNKLYNYCDNKGKKIVLFFDEIHDGIHNFNQENIFKLWKYQDIFHKIFIVSATFNEASKEVIKYLSEFTNRNIQIIESVRSVPKKQSRLHLIFNDYGKLNENFFLNNAFEEVINKGKDFDVIVYSKNQIFELFTKENTRIEIIDKVRDNLNFCYSDFFDKLSANKQYDEEKYNIGTNFTTGINISKKEHTLFVVFPIRSNIKYLKNKGIFTNGVNSVIQTLARQRNIGDIYLIIPTPYNINVESLPYDSIVNLKIRDNFLKNCLHYDRTVDYTNINSQADELNKIYDYLKYINSISKKKVDSVDRRGMNILSFPKKENFIMEKGEKYLTSTFFGGDLSTYIFWASITNQFQNCKLTSVLKTEYKYYTSDSIFQNILNEYDELTSSRPFKNEESVYLDYFSHYKLYSDLENQFIGNNIIFIDEKPAIKKQLETIKLTILNIVLFNDREEITESNIRDLRQKIKKYYFQSCIHYANKLEFDNQGKMDLEYGIYQVDANIVKLATLYKEWGILIKIIQDEIKHIPAKGKSSERNILPIKIFDNFKQKYDEMEIEEKLFEIINTDKFVFENVIPFNETILKSSNKQNTIYNFLKELVFEFELVKYGKEKKRFHNVIKITDVNSLEYINLLHDYLPIMILE
ncbi:DEAD/DEAH box helicase family protein [Flavobacterium oreochromis]|uniref:DEAD/DEAH box helicase family protein n=2 Tax=Flavobacterium TaxID=237 RepID=UPI00385BF495